MTGEMISSTLAAEHRQSSRLYAGRFLGAALPLDLLSSSSAPPLVHRIAADIGLKARSRGGLIC